MSELAAMIFPPCSLTDDSWTTPSLLRSPWTHGHDGLENDASIAPSDAIVSPPHDPTCASVLL
jgi:hypothetical protein